MTARYTFTWRMTEPRVSVTFKESGSAPRMRLNVRSRVGAVQFRVTTDVISQMLFGMQGLDVSLELFVQSAYRIFVVLPHCFVKLSLVTMELSA